MLQRKPRTGRPPVVIGMFVDLERCSQNMFPYFETGVFKTLFTAISGLSLLRTSTTPFGKKNHNWCDEHQGISFHFQRSESILKDKL